MSEILDDPEYWLDWALDQVKCGSRNQVGTDLACQLRDNNVPQKTAEKTMKRYAREVPSCGDKYTEKEALSTLRSVYRTSSRDPATVEDSTETDNLQKRAREREEKLLEKFRRDPTSLSESERKRLEYSPVSDDVMLEVEELEMAKEWMTDVERGIFAHACPSSTRQYKCSQQINLKELCDCPNVEYRTSGWDFVNETKDEEYPLEGRVRTVMIVHLSEEDADVLERLSDRIVNRALWRRSQNL
jgi:hypothetical protein